MDIITKVEDIPHGESSRFAKTPEQDAEIKAHVALRNAFTPFLASFRRKVEDFNKNGLRIPKLADGEPIIKEFPFTLGGSPLRTIREEDVPTFDFAYVVPDSNGQLLMQSPVLPIGEYGNRWSFALAQASRALYTLIREQPETDMTQEAIELNSRYRDVLQNHTFLHDAGFILNEAAHTLGGSLAILTAEKVPGYEDDPVGLAEAIVDDNLLNEFAAKAPMGIIVPMAIRGYHFDHPLQSGVDKHVSFTGSFRELLAQEKKAFVPQEFSSHSVRRGCPVARKGPDEMGVIGESGITHLAKVYLPYVKHVYNVQTA